MTNKIYPCDIADENGKHTCPFAGENESTGTYFCRDMCGLGVGDEEPEIDDDPEIYEDEVDESTNPYDGTEEWQNGFWD